MSIITLTTDFGMKDYFVAAIKGAIYSDLPEARIVDITHDISPFNITETAYIIKNAYKHFPKGTIHIIGVDSESNQENKHIALKLDGHYFVGTDNGIISLLTQDINPEKIVEITVQNEIITGFSVLDVFIKVACHIARGGSLDIVGKNCSNYKIIRETQAIIATDNNSIKGAIIYVDNYGNAISNINRQLIKSVGHGRPFEILAGRHSFKTIHQKYSDIVNFSIPPENRYKDGVKLAIYNSAGYLEIALYRSNPKTVGAAVNLLGLDYYASLVINFES